MARVFAATAAWPLPFSSKLNEILCVTGNPLPVSAHKLFSGRVINTSFYVSVTAQSWGKAQQTYLRNSGSEEYETLASRYVIVKDLAEGMEGARKGL